MQWRVGAPHPSCTPSPPYLRLPNLPILLPASRAPRPRYLLCTLRAPRRRHRVALDCECHVRRPAARALDPLAPAARTGGGGAASPAAASRLFPGLFRSAFPSPGPASTNLSKILWFRSAPSRGRDPSEEGALCIQQVALNSRPARPLLEGTRVAAARLHEQSGSCTDNLMTSSSTTTEEGRPKAAWLGVERERRMSLT